MTQPRLAAVGLVLAWVASTAEAQPLLHRGSRELAVHVSPDFEGPVGDTIQASAGFGLFVRDDLEARATLGYGILEDVAGQDSDYRMRELGLGAEYHFLPAARAVPYLGPVLGWRSSHFGDVEESGLVYGAGAGLKLFLADNVALDLGATYRLASADVFVNDFVAEDTDLSSAIGLRVLFGGKDRTAASP
ncbi:MAG: porin family protein [Chloroflexi bacterium]|nr:porin family protein [Chloroflexota bacterium]